MKNKSLKILLSFVALILVIQLFRIDKSTPQTDPASDFIVVTNPRRKVTAMLKASCYDCHSYKTRYPWYSNVAPVSWILQSHVSKGRENLNLSEYGNYPREKRYRLLAEMKESIEEQEMPLRSYTLIHKEAKLDEEMRNTIIRWMSQGKNDAEIP